MRKTSMTFLAVAAVAMFLTTEIRVSCENILGAKKCTRGPAHWCHNFTNSLECGATEWCVNKTWSTLGVANDNDTVCEICKNMTTEARKKLETNADQETIERFLGESCSKIGIEPIVNECNALVPRNYSDFAKILASGIDNSVVCSIVGLCNSTPMDDLIEQHNKTQRKKRSTDNLSLIDDVVEPDECSKCYAIANHMENILNTTSPDDVLDRMINACQSLSSFSDACGSIVIVHFPTIYSQLRSNFKSKNVCHLSGQCTAKFHEHEKSGEDMQVEIRPLSRVGVVGVGDDLPCKLCEQLVGHLRDLLIANTTENEFQQVLEGLCGRTKSFAAECKSIVDQYYREIYNYLVHGLNKNGICEMAGICPLPGKELQNPPITLLLPAGTLDIGLRIMDDRNNLVENGAGVGRYSDKMAADETPASSNCAMCKLYVQSIKYPTSKYDGKLLISKICRKLPMNAQNRCYEFGYKNVRAISKLVSEKVHRSVICGKLDECPSEEVPNAWKPISKDTASKNGVGEKPNCPLCLLAVGQLYNVIKDNKTEAGIEHALNKLCDHLPKNLDGQCQSLVRDYSKEIIETLMADLSPQEICVYIKLCSSNANSGPKNLYPVDKNGVILANSIKRDGSEIAPKKKFAQDGGECVICEFVMQRLDDIMSKDSNRKEIKKAVEGICKYLPHTISQSCNDFVEQYADIVIQILSEGITPAEACTVMKLCEAYTQRFYDSIEECATCRTITSAINERLAGSKDDDEIERVITEVCRYLSGAEQNRCTKMMRTYEKSVMNIFTNRTDPHVDVANTCNALALCDAGDLYAIAAGKRKTLMGH